MPDDFPTAPLSPTLSDADFQALLDVSLTALTVMRPLYRPDTGLGTGPDTGPGAGPDSELTDFACVYLNPAGQRMLGQPERPAETLLNGFPHARENGLLAFYRRVFETGESGRFEVNYQADGLDNYFYVAARRQGQQLLASFTDTASQDRSAVEQALRASQAAEAQARAEAETQRQRFREVLLALPAQVAMYDGPDHVYAFVNARYERYFPGQRLPGRPLREVLPETQEQGIIARLDEVYRTGQPYYGPQTEVWLDFARTGEREQVFLDLFFYPLRDAGGRVNGLLDFSYDVTQPVRLARREQVLADALRELNDELEERVTARAEALSAWADEARAARAEAERQRASLTRFLNQTKALVGILRGPDHELDYGNPAFGRLFPGRPLPTGRPVAELFAPGAEALDLVANLNRVYRTGESCTGTEQALLINGSGAEPAQTRYFTITYDANREQDQVTGVSIFAYDVTEAVLARRQNEALQADLLAAAQRQVRARADFHRVFEQTPTPICLLRGPEHRYEYFNPAYQQLFPGVALTGRSVAEALPEAAAQGFVAWLDGVYATGEPYFGYEVPLTRPDADGRPGPARYYTFTYQRLEEDGQPAGISVFGIDVTEQVLARQERATQQLRLHDLFEQAPVSIAVLRGPRYVFELANPVTCRLLGHPADYLLGKGLFEALPETAGLGFEELLDDVRQTGVPHAALESPSRLVRDGGPPETVYWNYLCHPLREPDGTISGVVTVATDATGQVRARQQLLEANEALRATNEQLTRANADLDTFVYAASHDLRQPTANLEGLLLALREELSAGPPPAASVAGVASTTPAAAVAPLLDRMQQAIESFQPIIQQFTDSSRPAA